MKDEQTQKSFPNLQNDFAQMQRTARLDGPATNNTKKLRGMRSKEEK